MSTSRTRWHRFFVGFAIATGPLVLGTIAACTSNSATKMNDGKGTIIGPNGGTVTSGYGAELRIPAGALQTTTTFSITVAPADVYPTFPGTYNVDGMVYAFTPHGTKFLSPVTVSLPIVGEGNLALHADPNGSWSETPGSVSGKTLELFTSGLSFFAVARNNADAGHPTCASRVPDYFAPAAKKASGLSGKLVDSSGPYPHAEFDLASVYEGYAIKTPSGVEIIFGSTCGRYANGMHYIAQPFAVVSINSAVTTQAYAAADVSTGQRVLPRGSAEGACPPGGELGTISPGIGPQTAMTITAVDGEHIAGWLKFTPPGPGNTELNGEFDVPFCQVHPGLEPSDCCL